MSYSPHAVNTSTSYILLLCLLNFAGSQDAQAAAGEMGIGVPDFGMYSSAVEPPNGKTIVWGLNNPTLQFPAGCPQLTLTPQTMGIDNYKMALATMLTAKVANKRVRFYAHGARDAGCGVDYIQMLD